MPEQEPPAPRTPAVAVITVAYHSDDVLPTFLESVATASIQPVGRFVVDNAPVGSRARELAAAGGATYISLPNNPGYGGAINAAARDLDPAVRWIVVCNPDVVLSPGAIDALVAVAESDDRVGAVGPAVLNPDGSVYPSARAVPSLRTGIGHALFVNLWHSNPWSAAYRREAVRDARRDAGWLSGSCFLVRRSVFEELGGFDEGYFMYFEDVDLGYRIGRLGYRNVYEPAASAMHVGGHSTQGESARMIRAHHDSARRFINRKYPGWWLWPVRAVLSAGLRLRSAWYERQAQVRTPRRADR